MLTQQHILRGPVSTVAKKRGLKVAFDRETRRYHVVS